MKGAVPILLAALASLSGFESERMYGIVFVVVLFSVVVHGTTVRLLVRGHLDRDSTWDDAHLSPHGREGGPRSEGTRRRPRSLDRPRESGTSIRGTYSRRYEQTGALAR
jgi:hypothetical protein